VFIFHAVTPAANQKFTATSGCNFSDITILMFFFFFDWAPVAGAPVSTAAMKAYCTSPALEVPAFTARSPHAYDARDL
jgi:hypothetical protein